VHLDGYLNVLRAALPRMAAARHGRILGVTSGSGWRPANAGAYSCAKRAVAALTWQLGRVAPEGVTINALSPIAATRMVTSGLRQQAPTAGGDKDDDAGSQQQTGGLSLALAAMPSPERLGPVGVYLGSEAFTWSTGAIVFSNGSEVAPIIPPELLEVARTSDVADLAHVLDAVLPAAFVAAEAAQQTNGASNGRFADVFEQVADGATELAGGARSAVLVTDSDEWASALRSALAARGVDCTAVEGAPADDFAGAAAQLARAAQAAKSADAVVVARRGLPTGGTPEGWQRVLDEHVGIVRAITGDVAWVRATSDHARETGAPVRIATVVDATTAGGRSRAQAAAQLSRAAHLVADVRADAFAIGMESPSRQGRDTAAGLVAHLVATSEAGALSGAELVVQDDWVGLRSHPRPGASISFGGPELPSWVDGALRGVLAATNDRSRA
jgi:hypothetical protein